MSARFATWKLISLYRNRGLVTVILGIGALAVIAIVTGRWGAQLLSAATGMELEGVLGEPSTITTWQQWMSNLNQIVLLVVAIWAGYTSFTLRRNGEATGLLTKPLTRTALLHVSWLIPTALTLAIAALGSAAVALITQALYADVEWARLAGSLGLWALSAVVWATIGALGGVLASSTIAAIVIPVVGVLAGGILSAIPALADYSFVGLFPMSTAIVTGPIEPWWAMGTGIAVILIGLWMARARFSREDL